MFALCTLRYFFVFLSNQLCTHLGTLNWFAHKCCISIMGLKPKKKICVPCFCFLNCLLLALVSMCICCLYFVAFFSFSPSYGTPKSSFVGFKSQLLFSTSSNASSSNLTSWHFAHPITHTTLGDFSYPFALTTSYISLPSNII